MTVSGIYNSVREEHPANANPAILITVSGRPIVVIGQPRNAEAAMALTPGGNTAVVQVQAVLVV